MGIGGVGMAGLAVLLKARGFRTDGCDLQAGPMADWLQRRGIRVCTGHGPAHVRKSAVNWMIVTSAVSAGNSEVSAAVTSGIPVSRRGEVLAALVNETESIAVAGTHGKTTTTGLTAQILQAMGYNPGFCIGGEIEPLGGVAGPGNGKMLVVEADESDGTLSAYRPTVAIVTNIEPDHLENFGSLNALRDCFRTFVAGTRRRVIYCMDDPGARLVCGRLANGFSYGFSKHAALRAESPVMKRDSSVFAVELRGKRLGIVRLPLPGRHNIANCLAALAAVMEVGADFKQAARAVAKAVLPKRRFEKIVESRELTVISDYSHHPTEIKALMAAATGLGRKRIVTVFQPHRYTRTLALGREFPAAFAGADKIILVPVYAASEKELAGGTSADLYAHWRRLVPAADVSLASSLENAWAFIRRDLRRGDLLLVAGAGSVEAVAGWAGEEFNRRSLPMFSALPGKSRVENPAAALAALLRDSVIRTNEPIARKTTLGTGGSADIWLDVRSESDLCRTIAFCAERDVPYRILGGGSNMLASDLGVRGITARLGPLAFGGIKPSSGGIITVGAAVPLARLVGWSAQAGYAGLEFLEGIPGTLGGALRMNAGAWGNDIGGVTAWVRCIDAKGRNVIISRPGFSYRRGVVSGVIVEAGLRLKSGNPAGIAARIRSISAKREWMRGLRSAGSVFRNPPGDYAGRLIEEAGLKGMSVGGAAISRRHANVIVTKPGARASDVTALIEIARVSVRSRFGVELEPEIEFI